MRIVLTGGGTGGHIYPLVAVANQIKKQIPTAEILYIGTRTQMHEIADSAMADINIPVKNILTGKMRRYFSVHYFLDLIRIPMGIMQSLWILLVYMPDAVFSKGGYAAVPVVIVAWLYRIPVLSHESDAIPGWANRVGGKFSRYVAVNFPEAKRYFAKDKTVITGNPMREVVLSGDADRARNKWDVDSGDQVVFVFGGSQGALNINNAVLKSLIHITKFAHVIHVSGKGQYESVRKEAGKVGFRGDGDRYTLLPFMERQDMADAYAISDLVITRPSASAIAEIAATKNVAIFIPHRLSANGHQRMNAFNLAEVGAALVLDEDNIGEHILSEKIHLLLTNQELRKQFKENIEIFYYPDASQKIVNGILQMLK